jgi:uncharacterized membrane protein YphA (DoxX/SURF4 family)
LQSHTGLNHAWWTLRIGLGLGPLLAGLDKFFNLLTNWDMYLNPLAPRLLHVSPQTFMHLVGVVEIVMGILVLTRFTRYAAYIVMVWMWAIAASLVAQGMFLDLAVRDIEISLGAFALAKLTEVRELAFQASGFAARRPISKDNAVQHSA